MSHLLHRHTKTQLPTAVRGEGVYLYDAADKQYLDASGGAAVTCLGYGHPEVTAAMVEQAHKFAYAHTAFFTSDAAEELADFLMPKSPGLSHAYFVCGGSEAMEAALKLARQYFIERGEPQRRHLIARRQSYHGNTIGALSVGGNEWRRQQFAPLLIESQHISPCYPYRDRRANESEFDYGQRVANELEEMIERLGADHVIGFVAEPVVGATSGVLTAVPGYFARIREICDQHGILLILDEVMCGMGRTGSLFACEQENVRPDIVGVAKGLGGGYQPIGATFLNQEIYSAIANGSGFFQHGHTYQGHPMACAAALAVQKVIDRDKLLSNVQDKGAKLMARLMDQLGDHPYIGEIRGRGLFVGLEIVEDRASKRPFDPSIPLHQSIKREAMSDGLMCYPMSGTIDGRMGHHVLLAPPFIISDAHIDELVTKLSGALERSFQAV